MNEDTTQAAQFHADMLAYEQAAREALIASLKRPLNADEISLIAFVGSIDIQENK